MAPYHCPHARSCPGCPLIELGEEQQLSTKRRVVERAVAAYPLLGAAVIGETIAAVPAVGYRVRAKLVAQSGKLGLYARGGHELVDIPGCIVLSPRLAAVAQALRPLLPDAISAVDLREADAGALVTLIARDDAPAEALDALAAAVAQIPGVVSVASSSRAPDSPQLLGSPPRVVSGEAVLRHHLDPDAPWGLAAHGAFTQAHAGQAARLHAGVERALAERLQGLEGRRVLELHGGSGLLALRLAARGARVRLVESFAPAVERAREAARAQGLMLEAVEGDAVDVCESLVKLGERFDAVLVNPPRRGLEARLRECVARLAPRCLVYVSCSPRSLARDAADFARLGLAAASFTPFDMIPLSDAVEVLAELVPSPAPAARVLFEDEALLAVEKLPHETVAALLERVRRLPNAGAAVAVQRLEPGASGVCLFARSRDTAGELERALGSASLRYLALAKGKTRPAGVAQRAPRGRYTRQRSVGRHSLLSVETRGDHPAGVQRLLAGIGHPLLGDARSGDRGSNVFLWHRFGLERPFLHLESVALERQGRRSEFHAALAPDLESVLEAMDGREHEPD